MSNLSNFLERTMESEQNTNQDFVEKVVEFNKIAGTNVEYNTRKVGLYTGLILEELAEMLNAIGMDNTILYREVSAYSTYFKSGNLDPTIEYQLSLPQNRLEYFDASLDIAVVALGSGISVGGDVVGGSHAVADNNLTKFPIVNGERVVLRDENGKVKKPADYKPVNLTPYVK